MRVECWSIEWVWETQTGVPWSVPPPALPGLKRMTKREDRLRHKKKSHSYSYGCPLNFISFGVRLSAVSPPHARSAITSPCDARSARLSTRSLVPRRLESNSTAHFSLGSASPPFCLTASLVPGRERCERHEDTVSRQ